MPIEVRELVIKATVVDTASSNNGGVSSGKSNITADEEIIKACVDKVLEIIKEKLER